MSVASVRKMMIMMMIILQRLCPYCVFYVGDLWIGPVAAEDNRGVAKHETWMCSLIDLISIQFSIFRNLNMLSEVSAFHSC